MASGKFSNTRSSGCHPTGQFGEEAFCWITSPLSLPWHFEWDGHQRLFAGTLVCPGISQSPLVGNSHPPPGRYGQIYKNFGQKFIGMIIFNLAHSPTPFLPNPINPIIGNESNTQTNSIYLRNTCSVQKNGKPAHCILVVERCGLVHGLESFGDCNDYSHFDNFHHNCLENPKYHVGIMP